MSVPKSQRKVSEAKPKQRPMGSLKGRDEARSRIAVAKFADAEELNLDGLGLFWREKGFSTFPKELLELSQLKVLSLRYNYLTALPEDIGQLAGLQKLYLQNNRLNFLPEAIGQLADLQELYLQNNCLMFLPETIGEIKSLRKIYLSRNGLSALPDTMGRLSNLDTLDLSNNQLAALPYFIGNLASLHEVRTELGAFLANGLRVAGNPLITPPPEVTEQGLEAIRAYLRELNKTGEPLYEAKIVLVGEGAAGKTTLKERLIHNRFATPKSTRGLEMESAQRPHPGKPNVMKLNFWDFGGQEDYRPAQQFFFSKGAVYLLIWNARYDVTQSNVGAWMRLIRQRVGADAKVLVVATHTDEVPPGPGVRQLCLEKFGSMIAGFYEVDSKSGKGIPELWAAIEREVVKLRDFGAKRPKSWVTARDAVLARRGKAKAHQMPIAEFREIAVQNGVSPEAVDTLAAMLTLQGRIVYHGDDPHLAGTVVLDPEWLMKAIAYVMIDKPTQEANGILAESNLARIWLNHGRKANENPIRYEKEHWNHLLRMMDRHDIVYQLTKSDWLVSPLVAVAKPEKLPWDGRQATGGGRIVRAECQLDDEIPGLMALFTVRTSFDHYDFQRYCWRSGVFLRDRIHPNTFALIEAKSPTRVSFASTGPFAPNFMERLAGGLEQLIHEMWPGGVAAEAKPYRFVVPCPTRDCAGYFLRDDLFLDLAEGEAMGRCSEGRRCRHSIGELLTGQPMPLSASVDLAAGLRHLEDKLDSLEVTLSDMRGGISDILGYVSNEAPRIYSLRPLEPGRWNVLRLVQDLFQLRVEVQIWCEEMNRPVPGAVEVVSINREWAGHLRAWAPTLSDLVALAATVGASAAAWGALTAITAEHMKELSEATKTVLGAVKRVGGGLDWSRAHEYFQDAHEVALECGRYVDPEIAKVLCKAAKKGGMACIQMDDDKRWRWVSREIADRNDRSVPKEGD
jgi:internalin A